MTMEDEELFELDEELGEEPNEGSPPELSPEELIEEIEWLLSMAVLKDPTPEELQQVTLLSARSVYDWRWGEMRWKRRCRFVAREFKGYTKGTAETFAPTAGVGARLVLLMRVVYKWMLQFVDVKDAFLLVFQKTCVLVTVPDWWQPENAHLERYGALHRSLPSQRNAASRWYDFPHDNLVDLQFETIPILPSVFRHHTRNLVWCTHVDDLILAGTQSDLEWCTEELKKKFAISDSGLIPRLHQSPREAVRFLKKRHEKYIPHLIDLYQVQGRKPKATPDVTRDCLDRPELSDMGKRRFRSAMGTLLYLSQDRIDIQHTVRGLAQYMSRPTVPADDAVKHLVLYLKGSEEYGLLYPYERRSDSKLDMPYEPGRQTPS